MILPYFGTGCSKALVYCTMSFCTVLVISVCKVLRHQSPLSAVSLEEMLFHKPVSWILLNWLNSLCEGGGGVVGVCIPFLELVLAHAVIPIAASAQVWRNIYALGSDFPGLMKLFFCGSPKRLAALTAPWRWQDFPQLPSSAELFLDLLCQHTLLHTGIALAEGTDRGSAVTALWHGGTTASSTLVTFWRVTRKPWQPWETAIIDVLMESF